MRKSDLKGKNKPYLIVIYGKDGCDKCARLTAKVAQIINEDGLELLFDLDYQNLSTTEGMIAYAAAETVNGQRLPAMQIMRYDTMKNVYVKMSDRSGELSDGTDGTCFVPVYLQLETDFGSAAPVIEKGDIRKLLSLAQADSA